MPLSVIGSDQGPALGSAIHAAVAAGCYADVPVAAKAMGRVHRGAYLPDEGRSQAYDVLFRIYSDLHDHFGRRVTTMRDLRTLRGDVLNRKASRS